MNEREFDRKKLRFEQGDSESERERIAAIDRSILRTWATGSITTHSAMERMKLNNHWDQELTDEGFTELAHSMGYWRPGKLPEWMRSWECEMIEKRQHR